MNARKSLKKVVLVFVMTGLLFMLNGCGGIPKGTMKNFVDGNLKLQAEGCGIVKADTTKTVFKIKCGLCGYENEEITIDTPVAEKPYTLDWKCPRCGNKQKVMIQVTN
ncbi:MAG: hypothetical protein HQK77_21435 [Desulfobacterales bacterium]|nr:hypothetical protein [Desulfobacterales bacterium]